MGKKGLTLIQMLIIIAIIGILAAVAIPFYQRTQGKPIISEIITRSGIPRTAYDGRIVVKGKALVWDKKANVRSMAFSDLDADIRPRNPANEKELTVFLVNGTKAVLIGKYSEPPEKAYCVYADIFVAYWPSCKPVGRFLLVLNDPPKSKPKGKRYAYYKSTDDLIADWINSLPRQSPDPSTLDYLIVEGDNKGAVIKPSPPNK